MEKMDKVDHGLNECFSKRAEMQMKWLKAHGAHQQGGLLLGEFLSFLKKCVQERTIDYRAELQHEEAEKRL